MTRLLTLSEAQRKRQRSITFLKAKKGTNKEDTRENNTEIIREHQEIRDIALSNRRRIEKLEGDYEILRNLTTSVEKIATKQDSMEKDMGELKADVKNIAEKPARRWESIVEKVLLTAIGIIVAYLFAQIGIG